MVQIIASSWTLLLNSIMGPNQYGVKHALNPRVAGCGSLREIKANIYKLDGPIEKRLESP